jgi:hypothetical protein
VSRYRRLRWVPFYLLFPLAGVLLYLDEGIPMADTWRMMMLGAIAVLICALAFMWIERHPRLVESEGVDSLRGHHLLQGMSRFSDTAADAVASKEDDAQFTPVRHGRSDE